MSGNNVFDGLFASPDRQNTHTVRAGKRCSRLFTEKGDITDAEYRSGPGNRSLAVDFCTPAVFTDLPLIKRASNGPFLFHNILISLAGFPA